MLISWWILLVVLVAIAWLFGQRSGRRYQRWVDRDFSRFWLSQYIAMRESRNNTFELMVAFGKSNHELRQTLDGALRSDFRIETGRPFGLTAHPPAGKPLRRFGISKPVRGPSSVNLYAVQRIDLTIADIEEGGFDKLVLAACNGDWTRHRDNRVLDPR